METSKIKSSLEKSCKRIAPAWPLKNFVAVNPYLGFTDTSFRETARKLARRGNVKMTMPVRFYLKQIAAKVIRQEDINQAFDARGLDRVPENEFFEELDFFGKKGDLHLAKDTTLMGIAAQITNKDWSRHVIENITHWASSYFDDYITTWTTTGKKSNLFQDWKEEASHDLSNEIMGLKKFREFVKGLPEDHNTFIEQFIEPLKINDNELEEYFHTLLLKVIGWSSYVSGIDYNNKLYASETEHLKELTAILLAWENYFLQAFAEEKIKSQWYKNLHNKSEENVQAIRKLELQLLLQEAYDFAAQREMMSTLKSSKVLASPKAPKAQMIFCIDVRSEVYRRNLENVDSEIETLGFAGFFGFPVNYKPIAHEEGKNQCPVLIPSSAEVRESVKDLEAAKNRRISNHQISYGWKKFKKGAISNFGFVSPVGISFLPQLIGNSFRWSKPVTDPNTDGLEKWLKEGRELDLSGIPYEEQLGMAQGMMKNLEVKDRLAPFVLITGHGSSSVNNPHASGYDCGACGGHSGEINALTGAQILNTPEIRKDLAKAGINIPENTLFLACLHNTTTDEISILNGKAIPAERQQEVLALKQSIDKASEACRTERSERFLLTDKERKNLKNTFEAKAKDWSEIRPEWGLAGCNAFIIAPREKTRGINLKGRAFLQSYNPAKDNNFEVLEGIMTAPMVVTSWINLQYFGSTVDTYKLGAGNKTLHNVTGAFGVVEGSGGDLKIGLPLQAVHNGEEFEHQPQRLNVVIDAPTEAINAILEKHEGLKQLCDNNWIKLLHLNEKGQIDLRYTHNLSWENAKSSSGKKKEELTIA
ncbi:hypothetical protein SAMN05216474_3156 [Lishizhenia tianjinensis]|uniref:Probable inorganic carbon transporter subunit DabA n=1 Tax=Lishizhenia tianjinensis TaxID=477690 RepID=A0A1I7BX02_9FLAO|nr:DUF2309 domain-containing protein [Lishizhenia tianjinensis]SFT91712.1 hypothetical protein SAMN05216474_3156 [Lishizhenia tianjinensis]